VGETFTVPDREVAVAVADGLAVALRVLRHAEVDRYLVTSLQERLLLLERLRDAERTLTNRASVQDVLDAIARGAAALLGDEIAWVRFAVDGSHEAHVVAAVHGSDPTLDIILTNGADAGTTDLEVLAFAGITAALEVPIRDAEAPVGTLVVASRRPGRRHTNAERDVLSALANRAADALEAARGRHAMDQALTDAVHQALHDPLTGLANRALLMDRLGHAVARCARQPGRLAVLFVDLDDFKDVNDTFGHAIGDAGLAHVGSRLLATVRPADTAARIGGDEVAIVIEDVDDELDARGTAQRLLAVLSQPVTIDGQVVATPASIGIAVRDGAETPEELLRMADLAMYAAKSAGKHRLAHFAPSMFEVSARRRV
jgi:diguanylate cyclase (GGDEF)-like protein